MKHLRTDTLSGGGGDEHASSPPGPFVSQEIPPSLIAGGRKSWAPFNQRRRTWSDSAFVYY